MVSPASSSTFGNATFVLDDSHITAAQETGILRRETIRETSDSKSSEYGVACDRQANIGIDIFDSQKNIQARCKMFASRGGFQLFVKSSSSKPNNSGNAKYKCKILNGQQFFDTDTPLKSMDYPFYMNVYGRDGEWKLTKANLCHNHLLFVGSTQAPLVEGSVPRPARALRNTTESVKRMTDLIKRKLLPAHGGIVSNMTGKIVQDFLMSEGCGQVSFAAISRMKTALDDSLRDDLVLSYQKLESYFKAMAECNPGSFWRVEREAIQPMFMRACFFPNAGIHAALMSKKLIGFDGLHLKEEMHSRGTFLVATAKDFNNHIIPFGLALVPVENYEHWRWFLEATKEALGGLDRVTILSDRQKGLLSAIADVFPDAGHRFCLCNGLNATLLAYTAAGMRVGSQQRETDGALGVNQLCIGFSPGRGPEPCHGHSNEILTLDWTEMGLRTRIRPISE